ncbi:MAG: M28 family peptidase [Deltaproteobacteria bacterium]|nr:M28 family peptidase [Deltaproteobacteria bacterium]
MRIAAATVVAVVVGGALAATCASQPLVRAEKPEVPVPSVDPARLEAHVRALAIDLHPRTHAAPAKLDAVADWIRRALSPHGPVEDQPFVVEGRTYRNVILRLGPGPENGTDERVIVGAHYDAALSLPGADDDASGVAGLIELAPLLAKAPLGVRVDLVAWTLEEPPYFATPHMGSARHARALREAGVKVRAALSLEMIGAFSDAPGSQRFPAPGMSALYGDRGDFIAIVGRPSDRALLARVKAAMMGATDLPVRSLAAPAIVQGVDWSDHRSYWAEGWTAVMITDTSFLRNARYHTAADTPDTLDYRRMAKVVEGTFAAVVALARQ